MRIFINAANLRTQRTGVGRFTWELISALTEVDEANQYEIFHGASWRQTVSELAGDWLKDRQNITHSSVRFPGLPFKLLVKAAPRFVRGMLVPQAGIVHETNYLPLFPGRRTINTIYDMSYRLHADCHPMKRVLALRLNERRMKDVAIIMTISENAKAEICDILQVSPDRVRVVYPGVNRRFRPLPDNEREDAAIRLRRHWSLDRPFLLYVGTIEPRKNLEGLLNALVLLNRSGTVPPPLVLVGATGWLCEGLGQRIRTLGLESQVRMLGYVTDDELVALYNTASCFCYPSFYEGFGLPVLEAMACGCPVIASNIPAHAEVSGNAVWLVNPRDPEQMADAIARLMTDEALRSRLRIRGSERAAQFSWENAARQTLALYEEVASA